MSATLGGAADHEITCHVASPEPLAVAARHPATERMLREQFDRLGATNYRLADFEAEIVGGPMVPLSVLGKLRHALIAALDAQFDAAPKTASSSATLTSVRESLFAAARQRSRWAAETIVELIPELRAEPAELYVLCRTLAQLDAALAARAEHSDGRLSGYSRIRPGGRAGPRGGRRNLACHAAHSKAGRTRHVSRHGPPRRRWHSGAISPRSISSCARGSERSLIFRSTPPTSFRWPN